MKNASFIKPTLDEKIGDRHPPATSSLTYIASMSRSAAAEMPSMQGLTAIDGRFVKIVGTMGSVDTDEQCSSKTWAGQGAGEDLHECQGRSQASHWSRSSTITMDLIQTDDLVLLFACIAVGLLNETPPDVQQTPPPFLSLSYTDASHTLRPAPSVSVTLWSDASDT